MSNSIRRVQRRALNVTRLEDRTQPAGFIPGFAEVNVASGLSAPTTMEFAPDGKLFICEQAGMMEVWENGTQLQANFFANTPLTVNSSGERGLLGVAFDPNYASNRFVYVYYTATTPAIHNRVARYTADANGRLAVAGSALPLLEIDNLSGATNHNGGDIHFGPDGKLYIAVGDNANGNNSQTIANMLGKMLRINSDGTIPSDNPFFNTATGDDRSIWALGLRNPYRFTFQPGTGRMHINDVGQSAFEEINVGAAGANYGWPTTEGMFNPKTFPQFTNPLHAYPRTVGRAITGGVFYNPAVVQFPTEYQGDYFFADYVDGWIRRIDLGAPATQINFASAASGPVDLKVDNAGNLYYLSINSGVARRVYSAPRVTNTTVNDGTSAQRSRVTSLAVTFNTQVTFATTDDAAFTLTRDVTGGSVGFTANSAVVNGRTVVTLSNFTGGLTEHGSLVDGRYTLTALANQIFNGVLSLDGNGDGNPTPGDNYTFGDAQGLFRFFGDANGSRTVDIADFGLFNLTYGLNDEQAGFLAYFDYDGNGRIDIVDFGQLSIRYFTPFP